MLTTWVNLRTVGFLGAPAPNLGPTWANLGQLGANLGPTWGQLGPTWDQLGTNLGQLGANFGPNWLVESSSQLLIAGTVAERPAGQLDI